MTLTSLPAPERPFSVEGITINLHTSAQTLDAVAGMAEAGKSYALYTLNLDHCVKLRTEPAFRAAYSEAEFVTADGAPITLLARLLRVELARVTGADLVDPLCGLCARRGLRVFLFGTTEAVLARTAERLRRRHPGLVVAGTLAPGPAFDPEGADADAAIAAIKAARADICLVALGAPKQELFAARATARTRGCGFVCVGAALDFVAGVQVRAPRIFRRLGLEWLWRLGGNPSRMWWRYAGCAVLMLRYMSQAIVRRMRSQTHIGAGAYSGA
jgi:exopolysaccharide biosynthesis WecB/TagA/CpsF family protein